MNVRQLSYKIFLECYIVKFFMSQAEKDLWFLFRMKYFQNSDC